MPISELNEHGFLPEGIHDASLDEIRERFGRFQRTDRRPELFSKLMVLLTEIRSTGLVKAVIVDGSFVTAKDEPSDIDLILILHADHDDQAELRPFEYNVLSKRRVRRRFHFDMVVVRDGSEAHREFLLFFQGVKGRGDLRKGVIRVIP
ncbi:MAG: DUF6932 family protein [Isosphaeraceae bacterium]